MFPRLGDIAVQRFEKNDKGGYDETVEWAAIVPFRLASPAGCGKITAQATFGYEEHAGMTSYKTDNLHVYEAGKLTVVGFGRHDVLDHVNVPQCRDELAQIIRDHKSKSWHSI